MSTYEYPCPLCNGPLEETEIYPAKYDKITKTLKVDEGGAVWGDTTQPKIKVPKCIKCGVFI